jgi:cytochrome c oxidase subunit II
MEKLRAPALYIGVIVAVLLSGLFIAACQSTALPSTSGSGTTLSNVFVGETIYVYGTDVSGKPIARSGVTGMMGSVITCAYCHGDDARGQTIQIMMSQIQTPDIRWSTLSAPPTEQGDVAFTPDSFYRAVTQGIDPTGAVLKTFMPRWQLTRTQSDAVIEYLRTR